MKTIWIALGVAGYLYAGWVVRHAHATFATWMAGRRAAPPRTFILLWPITPLFLWTVARQARRDALKRELSILQTGRADTSFSRVEDLLK